MNKSLSAQEKADQIHTLFEAIKNVHPDKHHTLTIHSFPYTRDLDESWSKEILEMEDSRQLVLLAKKDGITLFGQTVNIDREPKSPVGGKSEEIGEIEVL